MSAKDLQIAAAVVSQAMADSTDGYLAESANYHLVTRYLISGKEVPLNLLEAAAYFEAMAAFMALYNEDVAANILHGLVGRGFGTKAAAYRAPPRVKILADAKDTYIDHSGERMKPQQEGWVQKILGRKRRPQGETKAPTSEDSG